MGWIADLDFQKKLCQPIYFNCTGIFPNIYCHLALHINHSSDAKKLRTTFLQYEKKLFIDKTVNFILSLANVPALIKIGLHKKIKIK